MFAKLKEKIVLFLLKKYALGYLVKAYKLIEGYKTPLSLAGMAATYLAANFAGLDPKIAEALYAFFGGTGSIAFLGKMKRYEAVVNVAKDVLDEVKIEAEKPVPIEPPKP